ncbi:DNA polymerase III subunit beta [Rickettsiales bacterium LUAb2]
MKITIQVDNLVKALADVQGIVDRKSVIPILSNVMIQAENNKVNLYTTDMSLYVTKTVDAVISKDGSTTVPAAQLFETIRKLNSKDQIELELDANHLKIECNGFKGKFACLPVEDFPKPTTNKDYTSTFKLKSEILKYLIGKTKLAICLDESRQGLNGLYFHKAVQDENNVLRAVATDGHRLAIANAPLPTEADNLQGITIPKKTIDELSKVSEKINNNEEIEIASNKNMISFKFPDLIIDSNVVAGNFPEYQKVIPTSSSYQLEITTDKLLKAIDLVSTFSDDKIKAVTLNIKNTTLLVSATKESGQGEQSITLANPCGEMQISFNSKYLIDILALIENDHTIMSFNNNMSPTIIKNKDSNQYSFIIMPMNLNK